MPSHLIGLLLGTEEDWPTAFEHLLGRVGPIQHGGETHDLTTERVMNEPFDLRYRPRHALVIDRLAWWYFVPREWLKKISLMDDVYLLNNPFTFQAMEKHSAYCAMMRLGLNVPETWLIPHKEPPRSVRFESATERWEAMASRYNAPFDLDSIAGHIGYPLFMKPFDGGQWVGVTRVASPDDLHAVYDESGERIMHLQASVEDFDVFVRSLSIGAETMVMRYDPSVPLHARYTVAHDFLSPDVGAEVVAISRLVNAFFRWEFNSCETLVKDGVVYPIDYANASPDVALTSLHYYFPWAIKALVRWCTFCTVGPPADAPQPEHARVLRHRRPRRPDVPAEAGRLSRAGRGLLRRRPLPRVLRHPPRTPRRGDGRLRREPAVRRADRLHRAGDVPEHEHEHFVAHYRGLLACGSPTSTRQRAYSLRFVDFELTDEQRLIQDTVRAFVDERVLPVAIENDINHRLDMGAIEGMAELGILGIIIPEEYGGAGLDYVSEALACEEIERGEAAFRTLISVHVGLNSSTLLRYGTEEQKQRYLVPQARGEKLACFGLTEPAAGSDVAAMRTTARREGDAYVLNGQKNWISYASVAQHQLVFAKTDTAAKHKGISAFVLGGRVGLREDELVIRDRRVRDPVLLAVEDVGVALAACGCAHRGHVRAGARLRQAEAGELLAARLRHQVALFLLLGAVAQQRRRVQPDVDRDKRAERRLAALDLLAGERLRDVVEPRAAVLLRDDDPEDPELGHPLDRAHVEPVRDVVLDRDGEHALVHEGADGLLDQPLLVGELEVHERSLWAARGVTLAAWLGASCSASTTRATARVVVIRSAACRRPADVRSSGGSRHAGSG